MFPHNSVTVTEVVAEVEGVVSVAVVGVEVVLVVVVEVVDVSMVEITALVVVGRTIITTRINALIPVSYTHLTLPTICSV